MFGPACENGFWHVGYNNELYELFSESDIVKTIKIGRLRWAGHVIRMLDDNPIKKHPPETRWVQKSWKTKTEMDGWNRRMLSARGWGQRALDRREWKNVLEAARAQTGL
jgi:hypothetical protein